jgi:pyruvate dehydrogenase E2 component (dihydrolipoamide acetyltransferase)
MAAPVLMPKNSDTMTEGKVIRWLKNEGEHVSFGDTLVEIETDKADLELEATGDGLLRKILVPDASTAAVGQVLGVIGAVDEDISAFLPNDASTAVFSIQSAASPIKRSSDPVPERVETPGLFQDRAFASPLARSKAARAKIDLNDVSGSGPGGRVIGQDVDRAIAAASGISGAISPFAAVRDSAAVTVEPEFRDEPLSPMRQAIATRLARSLGPVPHFFLTIGADMKHAVELRQSASALGPQLKPSFNDIIIKACAAALQIHPEVNATFMGDRIRTYRRVHIGIAVAVEAGGVITPVLRDCDRKSLDQISKEAKELADRARNRKLMPSEYAGATFSVSNLGMMGIEEFSAIINPPEGAILAVGAVLQKPVVNQGRIEIGYRCKMTLSCDHRVLDGVTGARFLRTLQGILKNTSSFG